MLVPTHILFTILLHGCEDQSEFTHALYPQVALPAAARRSKLDSAVASVVAELVLWICLPVGVIVLIAGEVGPTSAGMRPRCEERA